MNTFGLCFSFMIPGLIIGYMAGWVAKEKTAKCRNTKAATRKLFIYSLKDEGGKVNG